MIDASAVLEALFNTPRGQRVGKRLGSPDATLHAPHLLDVEVTQVLRRYALAGEVDKERGEQAIADYSALSIERYAHTELLSRIWELRPSLTAYDAAYVALAEVLECPLVTCDSRLARAHGHQAEIDLVA